MKNLFTTNLKSLVLLLIFVSVFSCKKENTGSTGCNANSGASGFLGTTSRSVMFWISKDLGFGTLKLVKLQGKGGKSYTSTGVINKYFAVQPTCGTSGTITLDIDKNYTYQYTFSCGTQSYSGEFTLNCDNTCVAVEVK